MTEGQLEQEPLAILRDTLLPRLISGQLRLPEAASATFIAVWATTALLKNPFIA